MSHLPKVSIIIPTYNSERTLNACLRSVVEQTYANAEIIVIDGQSQDNTLDIVGKHGKIKCTSEPDEGIYDAMNKGIAAATGDWLYFLGSDDTLQSPEILAEVFTREEVGHYDVIYGNVRFKLAQQKYDGAFSSVKLLGKNICHQAIFTRKEVFARLGPFNTRYKALADYAFNMNWFHNDAIRKLYVDKIIAVYNEDGYCFNNPDLAFAADKDRLVDQYFPAHARWLYAHRNKKIVYYLLNKITK